MEEKYCERCGVFLGLVNPCKKYCEECKIIVRRERQALIKKGIKAKQEPALCAWCKKPMVRKVWSQKYHPECAADANKALTKKYKAKKQKELNELKASGESKITWDVQEPERARPQKHEPPKYTVRQMNDAAKRYGMSYGHYSTLLAQGKVKAPDER